MKLDKHLPEQDTVTIVKKSEVDTNKLLLSSKFVPKGQKVYEFSLIDGSIREAERLSIDAALTPATGLPRNKVIVSNQVIQKPGYMYFIALNHKNVVRKVKKFFAEKEKETLERRN